MAARRRLRAIGLLAAQAIGVALSVILVFGVVVLAAHRAFSYRNVTTWGFSPEEQQIIRSAIDRFHNAGLTLPATHIQAWNPEKCSPAGMAQNRWPFEIIHICDLNERVVIHELAHAWTYLHLDGKEREAWTERRQAASWNDRDDSWAERGAEHAADILTWWLYWGEQGRTVGRISGENDRFRYQDDIGWLLSHSSDHEAVLHVDERSRLIAEAYAARISDTIGKYLTKGIDRRQIYRGGGNSYADPGMFDVKPGFAATEEVAPIRPLGHEYNRHWVQRGPYAAY